MEILKHTIGNCIEFVENRVAGVSQSVFFECSCGVPATSWKSGKITFRLGGASDVMHLSEAQHEYGAAEKEFGFRRIEQGDSIFIGESGGEVAFYAWLMYGAIDLDTGLLVPVSAGTAYSYKVFTVRSFRGQGICTAYYAYLLRLLDERGVGLLTCRITSGNKASIRAHTRSGFRAVGRVRKIVLGGKRMYHADAKMRAWLAPLTPEECFDDHGFFRSRSL